VCLELLFVCFWCESPPSGPGPPHSWGFRITHDDAPQLVQLLWMSDQPVAETCTWRHTTLTKIIHAPGGIWTHSLTRRAAVDLRIRLCGHWDRHLEPNYPKCRLNILCATLCLSVACLALLRFNNCLVMARFFGGGMGVGIDLTWNVCFALL